MRTTTNRRAIAAAVTTAVLGTLLGVVVPSSPGLTGAAGAAPIDGALGFVGVTPCRVADTRSATGAFAGVFTNLQTRAIQIGGSANHSAQGGSPTGCSIPDGVGAVEVTVTATQPSADGFIRLFPAGTSFPTATFLNYTAGRPITNTGTVPLAAAGTLDLSIINFGGPTHVIVEVQGYFTSTSGDGFVRLPAPCRVADTRSATGQLAGAIAPGTQRNFAVAARDEPLAFQGGNPAGCGVPDEATAVEISLTVIRGGGLPAVGAGNGFLRVAASDGSEPNATFLNYTDQTGVTNTGTVRLAGESSTPGVTVQNLVGTTHVAIDVIGYFSITGGVHYRTVTPCRIADTRNLGGPLDPGATRLFQVAGSLAHHAAQCGSLTGCGVPQRATAVEAGVTAIGPAADGFSRPAPVGTTPSATFLNFSQGRNVTNVGVLPLGEHGLDDLALLNQGGRADYTVDVLGYFEPEALQKEGIEQLDGEDDHTCALMSDTSVACWGFNGSGRLGDGTVVDRSSPKRVSGLTGAVQVTTGGEHSCALLSTGSVRCWGSNLSLQLSGSSLSGSSSSTPLTVAGITTAVQITAGSAHTCALLADRTVRCWGSNASGQLGSNPAVGTLPPTAVAGISGVGTLSGVTRIDAGGSNTCAVLADRTVACWGANTSGQLGLGTTRDTFRSAPSRVNVVDEGQRRGVERIDVGAFSTCALLIDRSVRCWGFNGNGQLGDASTTNRLRPVIVVGTAFTNGNLADVADLAVGTAQTCVVLLDGSARCWGANVSGSLGDGTTAPRSIPVRVLGIGGTGFLTGLASITTADSVTCGLAVSGNGRCWGFNNDGRVGDGTTVSPRTTPRSLAGVTN